MRILKSAFRSPLLAQSKVTPSRTGYIFSPTVNSFTIDGGNVSGVNFTAAQSPTHTVQLSWNASTSTVSATTSTEAQATAVLMQR